MCTGDSALFDIASWSAIEFQKSAKGKQAYCNILVYFVSHICPELNGFAMISGQKWASSPYSKGYNLFTN